MPVDKAMPSLHAISPLDGRYAAKLKKIAPLLSEAGLIRARIRVESAWLLCLLGEEALGYTSQASL
jgi:adenylosuccinate lyase